MVGVDVLLIRQAAVRTQSPQYISGQNLEVLRFLQLARDVDASSQPSHFAGNVRTRKLVENPTGVDEILEVVGKEFSSIIISNGLDPSFKLSCNVLEELFKFEIDLSFILQQKYPSHPRVIIHHSEKIMMA